MIWMDNRQDKVELNSEITTNIESIIEYTLREEGITVPYEVSMILIDNESIKDINKEQRGLDKETDVLSFPMLEYSKNLVYKDIYSNKVLDDSYFNGEDLVLGDIALSIEKALEQSVEYGHTFIRELCYLTIHSVLHLLGYDHMTEEEKVRMRKREEEILLQFDLSR